MNEIVAKIQHFLPCGYLKFFSANGNWDEGRKTSVFFTDGTVSKAVPVQKLGAQKYTYTKNDPDFEKQFQRVEIEYPPIIERIINGEVKFSGTEYFLLLQTIFEFHLRGVAYENRTDKEFKEVYTQMSRTFNHHFFRETIGRGDYLQRTNEHLAKNWRIHIIRPETEEKFITSDNPCTIYKNPIHGRPIMAYLPIHPRFALIPYDIRELEMISEEVTDDALGILNGLQITKCVRQVYADHDLKEDPKSWKTIRSLAQREQPIRWSNEKKWRTDFSSIGSEFFNRFLFIRKKRIGMRALLSDAIKRALSQ